MAQAIFQSETFKLTIMADVFILCTCLRLVRLQVSGMPDIF